MNVSANQVGSPEQKLEKLLFKEKKITSTATVSDFAYDN